MKFKDYNIGMKQKSQSLFDPLEKNQQHKIIQFNSFTSQKVFKKKLWHQKSGAKNGSIGISSSLGKKNNQKHRETEEL